jgi:hypothetical protein
MSSFLLGAFMSVVMMLGAGASYGSGACYPHAPPLGRELFARLKSAGGMASTVGESLTAVFVSDFEAGMTLFCQTREADTPAFLRSKALYFAQFEIGRDNLYVALTSAVNKATRRVTLVSTNYETLIEQGAGLNGLGVNYSSS